VFDHRHSVNKGVVKVPELLLHFVPVCLSLLLERRRLGVVAEPDHGSRPILLLLTDWLSMGVGVFIDAGFGMQ
jgi:hypothetical protein